MLDSPTNNKDKYNYLDTCLDKIIDKDHDSKEESIDIAAVRCYSRGLQKQLCRLELLHLNNPAYEKSAYADFCGMWIFVVCGRSEYAKNYNM